MTRDFSSGASSASLPEYLLEILLEAADLEELKCTLGVVSLLQRKGGLPPFVTERELLSDALLNRALAASGDPQAAIRRGFQKAAARGTLLALEVQAEGGTARLYFLNDGKGQRAREEVQRSGLPLGALLAAEAAPGREHPNIFALYEDNIGTLTPLLAEKLKEAEGRYPWNWVRDAFEEAVVRNKRSWRYIETILERWAREGRGEHGKPRGHLEAAKAEEYRRSYGRYVRE